MLCAVAMAVPAQMGRLNVSGAPTLAMLLIVATEHHGPVRFICLQPPASSQRAPLS